MKTKEELNKLKEECTVLNQKLTELNEDELKQISGGTQSDCPLTTDFKYLKQCQKYSCSFNLQPLQGSGFYCPIAKCGVEGGNTH